MPSIPHLPFTHYLVFLFSVVDTAPIEEIDAGLVLLALKLTYARRLLT